MHKYKVFCKLNGIHFLGDKYFVNLRNQKNIYYE